VLIGGSNMVGNHPYIKGVTNCRKKEPSGWQVETGAGHHDYGAVNPIEGEFASCVQVGEHPGRGPGADEKQKKRNKITSLLYIHEKTLPPPKREETWTTKRGPLLANRFGTKKEQAGWKGEDSDTSGPIISWARGSLVIKTIPSSPGHHTVHSSNSNPPTAQRPGQELIPPTVGGLTFMFRESMGSYRSVDPPLYSSQKMKNVN